MKAISSAVLLLPLLATIGGCDKHETTPPPAATPPAAAQAPASTPPAPAPGSLTGRWELAWDMTKDGKFQKEGGFPIELTDDSGTLTGRAAADAPADEQASRFEGSVVRGEVTTVELRQLRGSYVGVVSGELLAPDRISGTWTDNEGHAGEVELIRQ